MPALPAKLVTTSGAGDCLVAGCCWGLLKRQDALTALAHGMVSLAVAHLQLCLYAGESRAVGGVCQVHLPSRLEHLPSQCRLYSAEGCPHAAMLFLQVSLWHASALEKTFLHFMQVVAHAAVETHLNVPEDLTLQGLAEGASRALRVCQRWDIPFDGSS